MILYATDPSTGKPSVSLTILWLSVVLLITMGVLQALGKIQETSLAMEFFATSSALYFGRRFNINKDKTLNIESSDEGKN